MTIFVILFIEVSYEKLTKSDIKYQMTLNIIFIVASRPSGEHFQQSLFFFVSTHVH